MGGLLLLWGGAESKPRAGVRCGGPQPRGLQLVEVWPSLLGQLRWLPCHLSAPLAGGPHPSSLTSSSVPHFVQPLLILLVATSWSFPGLR